MSRIWTFTLTVVTTVAATALLAVPAHAGKATPPLLAFAAGSSPDYGSVGVGESADRTFTLTNQGSTGSAAIKVTLTPTGAFTIPAGGDKCTGVSLGKKNTCTITVRYTPAGADADDTATLTASAKKPAAPATLTLTGTSPSGLSPGCALVDGSESSNFGFMDFLAGEVITLTAFGEGAIEIYWRELWTDARGLSPFVRVPATTTFVIPVDGYYEVGSVSDFSITGWSWSCTAGS